MNPDKGNMVSLTKGVKVLETPVRAFFAQARFSLLSSKNFHSRKTWWQTEIHTTVQDEIITYVIRKIKVGNGNSNLSVINSEKLKSVTVIRNSVIY